MNRLLQWGVGRLFTAVDRSFVVLATMSFPLLRDYPVPANAAKSSPLFSIVTVVKNNAAQLEQTIQSLLNQTCQDFEHIIIDGGSTDNFLEVVSRYTDRQITWISEADRGIYDAMNKGIARSTGKIIGTLNSGDFYLPQTLELVAAAYKQSQQSELAIAGDLQMITKSGLFHLDRAVPGRSKLSFSVHQPGLFVTKTVYEHYGLFDITYLIAGDYEFVLRIYSLITIIPLGKTVTQTSPAGVSGDYYAATLEAHRARLANNYPPLLSGVATGTKIGRIFLHLLLEKLQVWQIWERFRHQRYLSNSNNSVPNNQSPK
jgi:glycosyltransferase involved in cell wall biosynthesis